MGFVYPEVGVTYYTESDVTEILEIDYFHPSAFKNRSLFKINLIWTWKQVQASCEISENVLRNAVLFIVPPC